MFNSLQTEINVNYDSIFSSHRVVNTPISSSCTQGNGCCLFWERDRRNKHRGQKAEFLKIKPDITQNNHWVLKD